VTALRFQVYGVAVPKGSARAFVPKGWSRAIVTSANTKTKPWQALVAEGASRALADAGGEQLSGAIGLEVTFTLPRPASLPKRVVDHLKKPDLDKLLRAVKDALTKVVWHDDSQVVEVIARKRYTQPGEAPSAAIVVTPLATAPALINLGTKRSA